MGADCRPLTWTDKVARNRFRLDLSNEALPWAQALRFAIEIDGAVAYGFGAGELVDSNTVTFEYAPSCLSGRALSAGKHTLRFLGSVDNTQVASSPVDFDFSCGAADPAPSDDLPADDASGDRASGRDQGCSISPGSNGANGSKLFPALLLAALGMFRSRRLSRASTRHK